MGWHKEALELAVLGLLCEYETTTNVCFLLVYCLSSSAETCGLPSLFRCLTEVKVLKAYLCVKARDKIFGTLCSLSVQLSCCR